MKFSQELYDQALARQLAELAEIDEDFLTALKEKTNIQDIPNHLPKEITELPSGTILFLPGSPGRARDIANNCFDHYQTIDNPERSFHLHSGAINGISVASMASQMGFGSLEIALTELIASQKLGAIIRVGTCGALVEKDEDNRIIKASDILIAEYSSFAPKIALALGKPEDYISRPDPKVLETMIKAGKRVTEELNVQTHLGGCYSKLTLYRDEFLLAPSKEASEIAEVKALKAATGHLGSEMESAMLEMIAEDINQRLPGYATPAKVGTFCIFVGEIRDGKEVGFVSRETIELGKQAAYRMVKNFAIEYTASERF